jgi:hypothetical protein
MLVFKLFFTFFIFFQSALFHWEHPRTVTDTPRGIICDANSHLRLSPMFVTYDQHLLSYYVYKTGHRSMSVPTLNAKIFAAATYIDNKAGGVRH